MKIATKRVTFLTRNLVVWAVFKTSKTVLFDAVFGLVLSFAFWVDWTELAFGWVSETKRSVEAMNPV